MKKVIIVAIILVLVCGFCMIPVTKGPGYFECQGSKTKTKEAIFYTIIDWDEPAPDGSIRGGITGHEEHWFLDNWNFSVNDAYKKKEIEYYYSVGNTEKAEELEESLNE
jgi:hypothetical protein